MKALLDWFETKDDTDPVLKAAIAHLWFATFYPDVFDLPSVKGTNLRGRFSS
jgi:hypothetical protein